MDCGRVAEVARTDVTLCMEMGSFHLYITHFLFSFRARQLLIINGQQTLGVALPWGFASRLVRPHEKTLSISGDGGFLFSAMELETAVRLKLNLVHMIRIDGTHNMVAVQEEAKYKRGSGVEFGPVDVVKYAEAFGAVGYMAKTPDEIGSILRKAFEATGPVLIGIPVDYRDNYLLFENVHEHLLVWARTCDSGDRRHMLLGLILVSRLTFALWWDSVHSHRIQLN